MALAFFWGEGVKEGGVSGGKRGWGRSDLQASRNVKVGGLFTFNLIL
jgi:hypothetical protein